MTGATVAAFDTAPAAQARAEAAGIAALLDALAEAARLPGAAE